MKVIISILLTFISLGTFSQIQVGQNITGDSSSDSFGNSVDISSDGMIVAIGSGSSGSPGMVNNGLVRTYEFNGTQWNRRYLCFS